MREHRYTNGEEQNTVTVVGSTCPLGKHLVESLLQKGHSVVGLYRRREAIPLSWAENPSWRGIQFDLQKVEALVPMLATSTRIVWLGHSSSVLGDDPNVKALKAVLSHAGCRQRKVVFLSSGGSIYGNPEILPVSELHPCRPLSAYGRSKLQMEQALLTGAQRATGISYTIIRPGNIYGQAYCTREAKGCVAAFTQAILRGEPVPLVASGMSVRDFVHADDVVRAIRLALESDGCSTTWNVGSGVGTQIRQVLAMVAEILGRAPQGIQHIPAAETDIDEIVLDTRRIREEAAWHPAFGLRQGLEFMLGSAINVVAASKKSDRLLASTASYRRAARGAAG